MIAIWTYKHTNTQTTDMLYCIRDVDAVQTHFILDQYVAIVCDIDF